MDDPTVWDYLDLARNQTSPRTHYSGDGGKISMFRRAFIILLAGILVATLSPAGAEAAYAPEDGAKFNEPYPWGSKTDEYRIVSTVMNAVNHTPTGERILMAGFLFDRAFVTDDLIAACKRGVAVRVVFDGDIDTAPAHRLADALNADNISDADPTPNSGPCGKDLTAQQQSQQTAGDPSTPEGQWGGDGSYVKFCKGSCRGQGGNMHTKFYAFSTLCSNVQNSRADACTSETAASKNVIMVSSANLNKGGARAGWNDEYTMVRRPDSFAVYERIHREMTQDTQYDGDGKVEVTDGPYTTRFFPMLDATESTDPTMQDLNRIHCGGATDGAGVDGHTRINVSMFYWSGDRGKYIAHKLINLAKSGCRVSIIYGAPSKEIAGILRTAAKAGTIKLYDARWNYDDDPEVDVRTHEKMVLVNGHIGADTSSWQVWTGSQNWVGGSLTKGDEVTLNIDRRSAYSQYIDDWDVVRKHSRQMPKPR